MTKILVKKNNIYYLHGYFSWVQARKQHEVYLYETDEGDIIPVTQVEYVETITNEKIDLTYVGKINKFIKIIDEKTFYDTMLVNIGLTSSQNAIDAWIYFITCLINKTSRKLFYPSYYESKVLVTSKMLEEFMYM